ncbi:MAG: family 78 glycoside hydrolase catalytic domain [Clostridia bacterium]|nr:family 78 glycoside hydrolase catalytic domain [Clostridia bacterium]
MKPQFICHPDFCNLVPVNVFHKEHSGERMPNSPEGFQNRHILFRKKFTLKRAKKATLKITADDYYKLYINGQFVTQGPASSYPDSNYYNEIDVTPYLAEGDNTFAVHCYYQGLINRVWVSGDLRQMLWLSLDADGETVLVSDESWLCQNHTGFSALEKVGYDTAFCECYDSRDKNVNFFATDFDDSDWGKSAVYKNADYTLVKQPTKQLEIYDVKPKEVKKIHGGLFVDFGFEAVGYIKLRAKGGRGDTVTIRLGEELNNDGSVRYDMRCNCTYEDKWILSGGNDELSQFDYKAFRYAEILFPEAVNLNEILLTVRHYPFEDNSSYTTQSPDLLKILELCKHTVKYGTQECFSDCPSREKGQYLGDASVSARAQVAVTGDTAMMKKAIMDFCHSSFICPGLMAVSGASLMQEIADYSLQLPAQVCWVYSVDNDLDFVKKTEPYLTGMYKHFSQYMNEDFLLDGVKDKWNLVDWPDNFRDGYDFPLTKPIGDGVHNVINAFWCGFLQSMDEIYSLLNKPITGITKKAEESYLDYFYNSETNLFCDSRETSHSAIHSNILPLLFNIGIDEKTKQAIIDLLKEKRLNSMGVYMAYFALAALVKQGERELAEELATDESCWLNMLKEGATTTFEAWGKEQKKNTSLFHPWATAPLIVFSDKVKPY